MVDPKVGSQISYGGSVYRDVPSVDPRVENLAGREIVVVFKVVHNQIVRYDKAPDIAHNLCAVGLYFADLPEIGSRCKRRSASGS